MKDHGLIVRMRFASATKFERLACVIMLRVY
jgi:hypothetical protein